MVRDRRRSSADSATPRAGKLFPQFFAALLHRLLDELSVRPRLAAASPCERAFEIAEHERPRFNRATGPALHGEWHTLPATTGWQHVGTPALLRFNECRRLAGYGLEETRMSQAVEPAAGTPRRKPPPGASEPGTLPECIVHVRGSADLAARGDSRTVPATTA